MPPFLSKDIMLLSGVQPSKNLSEPLSGPYTLDKTTFNLGYLSVGQKIEKELQLMVIYSNSETIDSVFDKTLRLEFDGVAW